jgi:hypothetical protein
LKWCGCAAPEFDAVLKLFDAVPPATPSRREAKDIAGARLDRRHLVRGRSPR